MSAHEHHIKDNLGGKILQHTEVPVGKCYQCGKCSAGCPVTDEMDYPPSYILRLLQTETPENDDKVLRSFSIWVCLACEMCIGRCPMEIDIPPMMDFLRSESIRQNKVNPKAKNILSFHKAFLNTINNSGRLSEMSLIKDYKLRTFNLFQDLKLAPQMISKGKLHLGSEKIADLVNFKKIFSKTIKKEEK